MYLKKTVQKPKFLKDRVIGKYPEELSPTLIYQFVKAYFAQLPGNRFLIAYDMRDTSEEVLQIIAKCAKDNQKMIESLDMTTTDVLTFGITKLEYDGGIMITASKENSKWQGLMFYDARGLPVDYKKLEDEFTADEEIIQDNEQISEEKISRKNIDKDYKNFVCTLVDLSNIKGLKIIVDAANGLGGVQLDKLIDKKLIEIEYLNLEPNAKFPHYKVDLSSRASAKKLSKAVIQNNADLGVIFDAEGTGCRIVTEKGHVISNRNLLKFLEENFSKRPKKTSNSTTIDLIFILNHLVSNKIKSSSITDNYRDESINKELYQEFILGDTKETKKMFDELLNNLWYTWNPHFIMPIIELYGDGWRKNMPPFEFIASQGFENLNSLLESRSWEVDQNYRLFSDYLVGDVWFDQFCKVEANACLGVLKDRPIAYFSLEYGLIDWLQIYSGGLGVLAGDFLKQASDMGVPIVAVGIFYHEGYFHQDFGVAGNQIETYIHQNPDEYPLELVKDKNDNTLEVTIEIAGHNVYARAWKLNVGRVELYLLDTNYKKNEDKEDRLITAHLYGGGQDTRIRQELLLGIGGARLIERLDIDPAVYHMNEGHSGFLVLELAKKYVDNGVEFKDAVQKATEVLLFTNHTLKQAGNDVFPYELIEKHLASYMDDLKTDVATIFALGKDDQYAKGQFSMTMLGMRYAKIANAVSLLHGVAAKRIWPENELVPVTNGVHMPTWISPEIHQLLDKYLGENWHYSDKQVDYQKIQEIPDHELWHAHIARKNKLVETLNSELSLGLDLNALTIAWSRRLASYKRPDMILSDLERLKELVQISDEPLQILIAGKAHPKDTAGKEILQKMNQSLMKVEFFNKVVIVPGYNWQLARRIISGADVWLNTPYRFEEASGTSGMKASANGLLQLTTKDGWTDEVDWYQKGWVISEEEPAKSLHDSIEYQILPLYFDKLEGGYNKDWVQMMKNNIQTVLYQYSSQRMMVEYLEKLYIPIIEANSQ